MNNNTSCHMMKAREKGVCQALIQFEDFQPLCCNGSINQPHRSDMPELAVGLSMALVVTYKHISGQLVDPIQRQEGRIPNIQADKWAAKLLTS